VPELNEEGRVNILWLHVVALYKTRAS